VPVSPGQYITPAAVNVPFASGVASVDTIANTTVTVDVLFPAGRFTAAPNVVPSAWSGAPHQVLQVTVNNITKDGCRLYVYRTTSLAGMGVFWMAHQEMG